MNNEGCGCGQGEHAECGTDHEKVEVNFFNYVASMGYQSMIFLGEVPNPLTQEVTQSLRQAKFLIDIVGNII